MPTIATAGRRAALGDPVSAGAVRNTNASDSSSGASDITSRKRRSSSAARARGKTARPAITSGPTGCSRSSSAVTTPKLPPPPRSAQNSSGCSSADARIGSPLAVISSTARMLSTVRPCLRSSQPEPPPSASPATPGARHAPADGGEPVLLGGGVDLAPGQAAADADDPPLRVDDQLAQAADVDHEAVLDERRAGDRVAAAAHRDAHAAHPRERERGADLVRMGDAGDVARARLDHRVEERAGVLVLGLAGVVDMASQRVAQLVQGGVMDDRHIHPRRPPRTGYS